MSECNYFYGSQQGAPALGTLGTGDFVRMADAVLVDGYNSQTATTLGIAGSPARAVFNKTGHGMRDRQMVRVAGANESGYNGDHRIVVLDANNFGYDVPADTPSSATGTITAKVMPLDFGIAFTATNQRAYRPSVGNRFYLMANDNSNTNTAIVRAFRSMSAVTTGANPFPTVAQSSTNLKWPRPDPTSMTTVDWVAIGDSKRVWFGVNAFSAGCRTWCFFGDGIPFNAADAFFTLMCGYANTAGDDTLNPAGPTFTVIPNSSQGAGAYYSGAQAIARNNANSSDSLLAGLFAHLAPAQAAPTSGAYSSATAGDVSPISGGIELAGVDVVEAVSAKYWRRGRMPCLSAWSPPDFVNNDKTIYKNLGGQFDEVIAFRGVAQDDTVGMLFPLGDWDTIFNR